MLCQLAAAALGLYLLVSPLLAWRRLRRWRRAPDAGRADFYRGALARQAAMTAAALIAVEPGALGLRAPEEWLPEAVLIGVMAAATLASAWWLVGTARGRRVRDRLLARTTAITPRAPGEMALFVALAIAAGPVEELAYRGFLPALLGRLGLGALPLQLGASALLFGLGHLYQGVFGVIGTAALGALLTYWALASGSLLVPVIVHTLIDLRFLVLLRSRS